MRDFTSIMNDLVVTNKVSPNKEIDEICNKTIAGMSMAQVSQPTAVFFLGFDSPNFTYGNAVNVTSGGGRASFRLRMIVPGPSSLNPSRRMGGSVYIDNQPSYELPYVRQNQPSPGFVEYPFTAEGGWEPSEFGEAYIKEQMYTFSFGPDCVPLKVSSFPLVFREFAFYTGKGTGGGAIPTRTLIYQKNNPAGIIEVNGREDLAIKIQPTCEGAPSFQKAPKN